MINPSPAGPGPLAVDDALLPAVAICRGMGYHVVNPDDLAEEPDRPCELRRIAEAAGFEKLAANWFRAEPGEELPLAYHYHEEQEELFYVVEGTLHVETPEETFAVPEGSLFAVTPGSPQLAHNPADADEPVTALALGAPAVSGDAVAYDPEE